MKRFFLIFSILLSSLAAEEGFEYEHMQNSVSNSIHIIRLDPTKYQLRFASALDDGIGIETVGSLCMRKGAKAGINGGFFFYANNFTGMSKWTTKSEGEYFSLSDSFHPAFGWSRDGKIVLFDHVKAQIHLEQNKKLIPLTGFNNQMHEGETILFTPWFHRTTLTPFHTQEAIIENGKVSKMSEVGSNVIPQDGFILSSNTGKSVIEYGSEDLRFKIEVTPERDTSYVGEWNQVENIVSSFPLLIKNGIIYPFEGEGPGDYSVYEFLNTRHPRSAVGVTKEGTWIFMVVDGGAESEIGITVLEIATLMQKQGCIHAINLDGGSSSSMVIDGKYVNFDASKSEIRRVGNALLIFPIQNDKKKAA